VTNKQIPDIRAIIFDYGEVLTATHDPEATLTHRSNLARQLDLDPVDLWPYLFEGPAARKWFTGHYSREEFWQKVLEPRGVVDSGEINTFADAIFVGSNGLNPEMAGLVKELQGKYKLAVLSNASWTEPELQERIYGANGSLEGVFDVIVTSRTVGAVKPDVEIFLNVLSRLDVRPEQAVFVDDLTTFVNAASNLGIYAHWFTTPTQFRAYLAELGVL
jgi:putative hydrolase of the HAD superfamily